MHHISPLSTMVKWQLRGLSLFCRHHFCTLLQNIPYCACTNISGCASAKYFCSCTEKTHARTCRVLADPVDIVLHKAQGVPCCAHANIFGCTNTKYFWCVHAKVFPAVQMQIPSRWAQCKSPQWHKMWGWLLDPTYQNSAQAHQKCPCQGQMSGYYLGPQKVPLLRARYQDITLIH